MNSNEIILNLEMQTLVPNLERGKHVLIAVKNSKGEIMTGGKSYWYPEGITRFVGGGIDEGEDSLAGAQRELEEELKIKVNKEDLKYLAEFKIQAYVKSTDKNYVMTTYVYGLTLKGDENLIPSDDVAEIHFLDKAGQEKLLETYANINVETPNKDGSMMDWGDYGKIYGPIHKYVFDSF